MAREQIDIGTNPNDNTGDTLRSAGTKINDNFSEVYTAFGDGSALLNDDVDFGTNAITYANVYTDINALPTAADYSGMTAKLSSDNKLYFSNGTTWKKITDADEAFSGNYNDLTNKPTLFNGDYNSLINKPTIPSTLLDLGISDGTNGQLLTTNGSGGFSFTDGTGLNPNLWSTFLSDNGTVTTSTQSDTLTVRGGNNIVTTIAGQELTIDFNGSIPTNLNTLNDVSAVSPTANQILQYDGTQWNHTDVGGMLGDSDIRFGGDIEAEERLTLGGLNTSDQTYKPIVIMEQFSKLMQDNLPGPANTDSTDILQEVYRKTLESYTAGGEILLTMVSDGGLYLTKKFLFAGTGTGQPTTVEIGTVGNQELFSDIHVGIEGSPNELYVELRSPSTITDYIRVTGLITYTMVPDDNQNGY